MEWAHLRPAVLDLHPVFLEEGAHGHEFRRGDLVEKGRGGALQQVLQHRYSLTPG